jgi:flagellar assembly protein FliH
MHWPVAGSVVAEPLAETKPSILPMLEAPRAESLEQTAALEQQLRDLQAQTDARIKEALAAGRREGEAAARESLAASVSSEIERFKQLTKGVLGSAPALRKRAEADLVRLSIAISRRILHREIAVDSEALLGLTKAALSKIDQREIHKIRTHPDNVAVLQRVLEQGRSHGRIEISGDARLERGALVIDTARGQFDASIETQLEEIERGFTDLVGNQG